MVATWLELYEKLMPNGRLMVNCGAANDGASNTISPEVSSIDGTWVQNSTIKALCQAFPGHVGLLLAAQGWRICMREFKSFGTE
ncbi:unnamed protein product [Camellia sinensis]